LQHCTNQAACPESVPWTKRQGAKTRIAAASFAYAKGAEELIGHTLTGCA